MAARAERLVATVAVGAMTAVCAFWEPAFDPQDPTSETILRSGNADLELAIFWLFIFGCGAFQLFHGFYRRAGFAMRWLAVLASWTLALPLYQSLFVEPASAALTLMLTPVRAVLFLAIYSCIVIPASLLIASAPWRAFAPPREPKTSTRGPDPEPTAE